MSSLDWLRGVAVLIMIEAHTFDAWTRGSDRTTTAFGCALMVGGMGAPLFLFLAGVAAVLAAESRSRRLGDPAAAARSVRRRGWQVFALAFGFRLQSYLLNPGASLDGLLKVDVLNVMGPSIVGVAWLWQLGRTTGRRAWLFVGATTALALVTPLVRASHSLDIVPDPLEAYLRPLAGRTTFTFLPWSGFVTAGAAAGLAIAKARDDDARARVAAGCAAAGALLVAAGYGTSLLPSIYQASSFWTSSPTFFCLRVGLLSASVALAHWWDRRPWPRHGFSPIQVLGESSLFVYWIHVELVYGVLGSPIRHALPLAGSLAGWALFSGLMLGAVLLKDRVLSWWDGGPPGLPLAPPTAG